VVSTGTTTVSSGTDVGADRATPAARLEALTKRFGNVVAVDDINLDIREGEFFSLLGPSGSGKTTLLRLIAGFEQASFGRILLHGEDVTKAPPFERDVNTVFQDYALFPHMSVGQNVAYGLMVRKVPKAERQQRVAEALAVVRLSEFEGRRPNQLSGGQRQRVALARALVNRPRMLLLDEPLGALDRRLREEMQIELKHIQSQVGITFVFVTHDQGEALTMSDRVAVFNQGRIDQLGTPAEIYERPETEFVAGFVGTSNMLTGASAAALLGDDAAVTIRPEKIQLRDPSTSAHDDEVVANGTIEEVQYLGAGTRYRVALDAGGELIVDEQNTTTTSEDALAARGRKVLVAFDRQHARRVQISDVSKEGEETP
jgi:putative spermidine/putrescine transport system ATP-binding protein